MSPEQQKELERHHARLNEQGETLIKGTMLWLILEALENLRRIERLLGPDTDRVSKKALRPILRDTIDQLNELKRRLD